MLIFGMIALIGLVVYLFMSIGGHAADAAHDMVHGDTGHDGDNGHMVSVFSPRVVAIFMMGFGATGALARYSGCSYITSCFYALCVGFTVGGIMWAIAGFFAKSQSNSLFKTSDLVGQIGTVDVTIDHFNPGEVSIQYSGRTGVYTARSKGGKSIGKGHQVKVIETSGSDLTVEEIQL